jgi:hypothetical protein
MTLLLLQLLLHVDASSLPTELAGSLNYSHHAWIETCHRVAQEKVALYAHPSILILVGTSGFFGLGSALFWHPENPDPQLEGGSESR